MKKCWILGFWVFAMSGCTKVFLGDVPANTPETNFNYFMQQMDENYSGKDVRTVNWDSLSRIYRSKINAQSSNTDLINAMSALMLPFGDLHLNFNTIPNRFYNPALFTFFPDFNNLPNVINNAAFEKSLKSPLKAYKSLFFYAKTSENIGYVNIKTFSDDNFKQADFEYFNTILEELKDTKGLVLDVRQNGGGSENFAQIVAGRLVANAQTYKYTRIKIGRSKTDYTDFLPSTLSPSGSWQYTKPIVVLTNAYAYSTAINLVMMLRTQTHVTTMGTPTGDGVAGGISREMPNGWRLQIPSGLAFLPDKTAVEGSGGIKPKVEATISEDNRKNGVDAILDKALLLLK
jgi:carboxyl-terminal processing protease